MVWCMWLAIFFGWGRRGCELEETLSNELEGIKQQRGKLEDNRIACDSCIKGLGSRFGFHDKRYCNDFNSVSEKENAIAERFLSRMLTWRDVPTDSFIMWLPIKIWHDPVSHPLSFCTLTHSLSFFCSLAVFTSRFCYSFCLHGKRRSGIWV